MTADDVTPEMAAARAKLAAKFNKSGVRTGGAGTVRRTKKAPHKATNTDDKKVQKELLKKYNCSQIQGIEEVHLFKDNGEVIRFVDNPKVQASIQSNFYAVSGTAETKKLQELLPGIISHLGNDSIANLKKIAESMGGAGGAEEDDDDAIPDLVEDFDTAE